MKPDSHDIRERATFGYGPTKLHELICRCGWKTWEDTEVAATMAWMVHCTEAYLREAATYDGPLAW